MKLCPNRGNWRRPGPEERLIFLLLLPQQLMLSDRMGQQVTWPRAEPGCCWMDVRQITCGSTIQGNVEAVLLMLYQICLFLLCHKEVKAARRSRRGSSAVLTGWRGIWCQTHTFTQLYSVSSPLEPPSWTRGANRPKPWLNLALRLVWRWNGLFTIVLDLPLTHCSLDEMWIRSYYYGAKQPLKEFF